MKKFGNGQLFSAVVGAPFGALDWRRAARQIERYLRQPDFRFSLPLAHEEVTHF